MPYYPSSPEKEPSSSPKDKKIIRRIGLCVSLLLIACGAFRLVPYGMDLISVRKTTQEMREIASAPESAAPEAPERTEASVSPFPAGETPVPSAVPVQPPENQTAESGVLPTVEYPNGYQVVSRIRDLRKKNQYVIGWITMDDLDEPVVLKDNTFFLNHDAAGNRNSNGAIFMDQNTNLVTRPYTILLYGHNMKTGAMFGNLRKYEDPSYCFRHRVFRFDTLFEEGQYVIFSVATIDLSPGRSRYITLSDLQSSDPALRQRALDTLKARGMNQLAPEVKAEDQVLLLVTCVGDDDERLVVAARRLREGEDADILIPQ